MDMRLLMKFTAAAAVTLLAVGATGAMEPYAAAGSSGDALRLAQAADQQPDSKSLAGPENEASRAENAELDRKCDPARHANGECPHMQGHKCPMAEGGCPHMQHGEGGMGDGASQGMQHKCAMAEGGCPHMQHDKGDMSADKANHGQHHKCQKAEGDCPHMQHGKGDMSDEAKPAEGENDKP